MEEYQDGHKLHGYQVAIIHGKISGTGKIGGICGDIYKYASIENCYNTGTITNSSKTCSNYSKKYYIGGIAGDVNLVNGDNYKVENCFNEGKIIKNLNIEEGEILAGCIFGSLEKGLVNNCYYIKDEAEVFGLVEEREIITITNVNEVKKGDTNLDEKIDIKDIMQINLHRLNKNILEWINEKISDVNIDGQVDIKDIMQINLFRLGKITTL